MRRFHVTASGIWRAILCLGSAILPRTSETSEYTEDGNAVHAFLMNVNRLRSRDEALVLVPKEHRGACALIDTEKLPVDAAKYAAEVAFALDVVSGKGRELHRKGDRDYSMCTPTEIAGTADVVALVGDDTVLVVDYKRGHSYRPHPEVNWQFKFLALAAARAYSTSERTITRALVQMVRIGEDGYPYTIRGELDLFDLAEVSEEVRELHANGMRAAAADVELPLVTGSHCKGCPAMLRCNAATALVRAPHQGDQRIVGLAETGGMVSNDDVLFAIGVRDAAKTFLKKLEEQLESVATARYHAGDPITLPDGSQYIPVEKSRSEPAGRAAWNMIATLFGEKAAWDAVELKASWESFEDLARAEVERLRKENPDQKPKPTIKRFYEGWREELFTRETSNREVGGKKGEFVKYRPYTAVQVVPPKRLKQ